jgi:high-affinity K+ transport system ATPase subunit B
VLTTFSIANDVAKYFAIIPAMFMGVYPEIAPSISCIWLRRRAQFSQQSFSML